MATLRDIRRRIRSVESTQKITRAMKLVAAAKLRRAQERIMSARPYAVKMAELLSSLVRRAEGEAHPLLVRREAARKRLVIITADKGLCGAFNSNILRASLAFLREHVPPKASPMCGNTICQDRRFLARWMPELEDYFHYRNLDVSTLKELCKRWQPDVARGWTKQGKHEALADIYESIDELKYYRDHFIRAVAS